MEHPGDVPPAWRHPVVFIGKLEHAQPGQDPLRRELIERLHQRGKLRCYGCLGGANAEGLDFLRAIRGADIALSVNAFNDVPRYHSDRLIRCVACGTFTLARRVPESEQLFRHGEHLCYFDTLAECEALIEQYLADAPARRRIAAAGMAHAHAAFNGQRLAQRIIDLTTTGRCDEPWAEIL